MIVALDAPDFRTIWTSASGTLMPQAGLVKLRHVALDCCTKIKAECIVARKGDVLHQGNDMTPRKRLPLRLRPSGEQRLAD